MKVSRHIGVPWAIVHRFMQKFIGLYPYTKFTETGGTGCVRMCQG